VEHNRVKKKKLATRTTYILLVKVHNKFK